jgi:hypothetical protein
MKLTSELALARKINNLGKASRLACDMTADYLALAYIKNLEAVVNPVNSDFGTLQQMATTFRYELADLVRRKAAKAGAYRINVDLNIVIALATNIVRTELLQRKLVDKLALIREEQNKRKDYALRCTPSC